MKGIDGLEVWRRMKENKSKENIKVIMIKWIKRKEEKVRGIEEGEEDFI